MKTTVDKSTDNFVNPKPIEEKKKKNVEIGKIDENIKHKKTEEPQPVAGTLNERSPMLTEHGDDIKYVENIDNKAHEKELSNAQKDKGKMEKLHDKFDKFKPHMKSKPMVEKKDTNVNTDATSNKLEHSKTEHTELGAGTISGRSAINEHGDDIKHAENIHGKAHEKEMPNTKEESGRMGKLHDKFDKLKPHMKSKPVAEKKDTNVHTDTISEKQTHPNTDHLDPIAGTSSQRSSIINKHSYDIKHVENIDGNAHEKEMHIAKQEKGRMEKLHDKFDKLQPHMKSKSVAEKIHTHVSTDTTSEKRKHSKIEHPLSVVGTISERSSVINKHKGDIKHVENIDGNAHEKEMHITKGEKGKMEKFHDKFDKLKPHMKSKPVTEKIDTHVSTDTTSEKLKHSKTEHPESVAGTISERSSVINKHRDDIKHFENIDGNAHEEEMHITKEEKGRMEKLHDTFDKLKPHMKNKPVAEKIDTNVNTDTTSEKLKHSKTEHPESVAATISERSSIINKHKDDIKHFENIDGNAHEEEMHITKEEKGRMEKLHDTFDKLKPHMKNKPVAEKIDTNVNTDTTSEKQKHSKTEHPESVAGSISERSAINKHPDEIKHVENTDGKPHEKQMPHTKEEKGRMGKLHDKFDKLQPHMKSKPVAEKIDTDVNTDTTSEKQKHSKTEHPESVAGTISERSAINKHPDEIKHVENTDGKPHEKQMPHTKEEKGRMGKLHDKFDKLKPHMKSKPVTEKKDANAHTDTISEKLQHLKADHPEPVSATLSESSPILNKEGDDTHRVENVASQPQEKEIPNTKEEKRRMKKHHDKFDKHKPHMKSKPVGEKKDRHDNTDKTSEKPKHPKTDHHESVTGTVGERSPILNKNGDDIKHVENIDSKAHEKKISFAKQEEGKHKPGIKPKPVGKKKDKNVKNDSTSEEVKHQKTEHSEPVSATLSERSPLLNEQGDDTHRVEIVDSQAQEKEITNIKKEKGRMEKLHDKYDKLKQHMKSKPISEKKHTNVKDDITSEKQKHPKTDHPGSEAEHVENITKQEKGRMEKLHDKFDKFKPHMKSKAMAEKKDTNVHTGTISEKQNHPKTDHQEPVPGTSSQRSPILNKHEDDTQHVENIDSKAHEKEIPNTKEEKGKHKPGMKTKPIGKKKDKTVKNDSTSEKVKHQKTDHPEPVSGALSERSQILNEQGDDTQHVQNIDNKAYEEKLHINKEEKGRMEKLHDKFDKFKPHMKSKAMAENKDTNVHTDTISEKQNHPKTDHHDPVPGTSSQRSPILKDHEDDTQHVENIDSKAHEKEIPNAKEEKGKHKPGIKTKPIGKKEDKTIKNDSTPEKVKHPKTDHPEPVSGASSEQSPILNEQGDDTQHVENIDNKAYEEELHINKEEKGRMEKLHDKFDKFKPHMKSKPMAEKKDTNIHTDTVPEKQNHPKTDHHGPVPGTSSQRSPILNEHEDDTQHVENIDSKAHEKEIPNAKEEKGKHKPGIKTKPIGKKKDKTVKNDSTSELLKHPRTDHLEPVSETLTERTPLLNEEGDDTRRVENVASQAQEKGIPHSKEEKGRREKQLHGKLDKHKPHMKSKPIAEKKDKHDKNDTTHDKLNHPKTDHPESEAGTLSERSPILNEHADEIKDVENIDSKAHEKEMPNIKKEKGKMEKHHDKFDKHKLHMKTKPAAEQKDKHIKIDTTPEKLKHPVSVSETLSEPSSILNEQEDDTHRGVHTKEGKGDKETIDNEFDKLPPHIKPKPVADKKHKNEIDRTDKKVEYPKADDPKSRTEILSKHSPILNDYRSDKHYVENMKRELQLHTKHASEKNKKHCYCEKPKHPRSVDSWSINEQLSTSSESVIDNEPTPRLKKHGDDIHNEPKHVKTVDHEPVTELSRKRSPILNEQGDIHVENVDIEAQEKDMLTKEEKAKMEKLRKKHGKHYWVTREIAEIMGREYILLTTLRDTLFFGIFLILMTIACIGTIESEAHNLFKLMEREMLHNNGFFEVNTPSQFWTFMDNFFENSFYWDYWYYPEHEVVPTDSHERYVFYENKLVGVPRIRQLKVRGDSCMIHAYFKKIFINCFGKFTWNNEDTSTFGPGNDTAWKYTPESTLQDSRHYGQFAWYHGGGFYKDLSLTKNETKAIIEGLKENLWITRGTRAIFLDWTMYNTNLNLFLQFKLVFEFPRTGGIVAMPSAHMCSLLRYQTKYDFFILACEFICVLFLIYYTIEEIREIVYFKWKYLIMFWSWVDLTILVFGYAALGLRIYAELSTVGKLAHLLERPDLHSNMQVLMQRMLYYKILLSCQLFFIYMKIFKYLNFNKSMAQLNKTLSQCRRDMMGFGLMFFIIFIAFAILGYLIFGTEVETFSSFYLAMFTLLRTILGDFDYTDIEKANRILAPIFFLMFIFLVFFVLLNMFLAIINDTYIDVKTELALAPEEMRMSGFVKRGYYNVLIKMGFGRYVKFEELKKNEFEMTTSEIKGALKRIGFSDLEIEMFLSRYNIDTTTDVQHFDVQKLIEMLEGKLPHEPGMKSKKTGHDYDEPLIALDDFLEQQHQLERIEQTIHETTKTLHTLLQRLERMDNVRKTKLEEHHDEYNPESA